MESQIKVDDTFSYGDMCYFTFPCRHDIIVNGHKRCASAVTIAELFKQRNLKVPEHFDLTTQSEN
jgi:hypothetical protein